MLKNILVFTGEWIHISPDFIEVNFPQFRNGWNFALCYACSVTFKKRCPVCNSGNCVNFFNNAKFNLFCICHIFCLCDIQFSSVTQSCLTLCDPMNRTTPGLPVHHHLLEFTQTHVHWVGDAIQSSHPLLSPSPPAPKASLHQSFPVNQVFTWGGQSTGVSALASFLPKKSQGWSPSEWTGWISKIINLRWHDTFTVSALGLAWGRVGALFISFLVRVSSVVTILKELPFNEHLLHCQQGLMLSSTLCH